LKRALSTSRSLGRSFGKGGNEVVHRLEKKNPPQKKRGDHPAGSKKGGLKKRDSCRQTKNRFSRGALRVSRKKGKTSRWSFRVGKNATLSSINLTFRKGRRLRDGIEKSRRLCLIREGDRLASLPLSEDDPKTESSSCAVDLSLHL